MTRGGCRAIRTCVSSCHHGSQGESQTAATRVRRQEERDRDKWVRRRPRNVVFKRSRVDLGSTFYWPLTCFSISEKGIVIVTNFMVIVRLK